MKYVVLFTLLLIQSVAYGQQVARTVVYFDYAKAELTAKADSTLSALALAIKSGKVEAITISGHTDADGADGYNQALSQTRAERVRSYLIAAGITADKIRPLHFGEKKPVVSNIGEDNKQKNRRVEITVQYEKYSLPAASKQIAKNSKAVYHQSSSQLPVIAKEQIQKFTVSSENEIVIRGSKGTVLVFEKNTFITRDGAPVAGEVTIELVEVYTKPEIIMAHLHTVSDSRLLETSGMIYLKVKADNQELLLKEDKYYRIKFPTTDKKANVTIFYGEMGGTSLNWKQSIRDFDPAYNENKYAFDKYVFTASQFGWINCDRFLNRAPVTNLLVTATDTTNVNFCLVFKSINSVMNVSDRHKGIRFNNVPINEVAAVIAFKKTLKGVYYASKKFTIQDNQVVALALEKVTEEDFKQRISYIK